MLFKCTLLTGALNNTAAGHKIKTMSSKTQKMGAGALERICPYMKPLFNVTIKIFSGFNLNYFLPHSAAVKAFY